MRISFLLWAQMRVAAGRSRIEIELPDGSRLNAALDRFYESYPDLVSHRATARAAVDGEYVRDNRLLHDGTEISLIPPVQGG